MECYIKALKKNLEEIDKYLYDINIKYELDKYKNILKFEKILKIEHKPDDITISNMTLSCALPIKFYSQHIGKNINICANKIFYCKYGDNVIRTVYAVPEKDKLSTKKFFNQVTLKVQSKSSKIGLKLFDNGAMHLTGCKSIESMVDVLEKTFNEIKIPKYEIINNKVNKIENVNDIDKLRIGNLNKFMVDMINCNYNIGFSINRKKLYSIMQDDKVYCNYDPTTHAGINVSYSNDGIDITILIFEKGSILITGARNCIQIKKAYDYINNYLIKNYFYIFKNDDLIDKIITNLI